MFGHEPFYFGTITKMINYFGTVFNEVVITRTDSSNNQSHKFRVPLEYGPKDKAFARLDADPNIDRDVAIILPRMAFNLESITYAPDRKRADHSRYIVKNDSDLNKFKTQYQEVPFDYHFVLWIYAKHLEDGNKVLEQINPFFTPEFTATINILPEMGIQKDIPIVRDSITYEDLYTGTMEERRMIVWTLDFRVLGMMFGPIINKPVIKLANVNFFVGNVASTNTIIDRIKVEPGLDANGDGTTNAAISIPSANIAVDDNWDYIVTFEEDDD